MNNKNKVVKTDLLATAFNEAKLAKIKNKNVIDAVVGSLSDEQGKFFVFKSVNKIFSKLSNKEIFEYNSVSQSVKFRNNMFNWIFSDLAEEFNKKFKISSVISPGSSTSLFISLYINNEFPTLNSSFAWPAYRTMSEVANQEYFEYEMFDKNLKFNLKNFSNAVTKLLKKNKGINIIFNDPCHNPTGYTLSDNEWNGIISFLNKFPSKEINIILDTAYAEFSHHNREFLKKILMCSNNINIFLCYSCSKTFTIYGLRLGIMFALSKNDYTDKFKKYSRAIFSNPPAFPISIVNKLFDDKKEFNSYVSELNDKIKLLDERASIFIDEAKKCKLVHCEYRGGFFILIPCKNSIDVYNKLKKQNIYIAPLDGGIRIAISYITKKEIRNLAKKIHDAMQSN